MAPTTISELYEQLEFLGWKVTYTDRDEYSSFLAAKNRQSISFALTASGKIQLIHNAKSRNSFGGIKNTGVYEGLLESVEAAYGYILALAPVVVNDEPRIQILNSPED